MRWAANNWTQDLNCQPLGKRGAEREGLLALKVGKLKSFALPMEQSPAVPCCLGLKAEDIQELSYNKHSYFFTAKTPAARRLFKEHYVFLFGVSFHYFQLFS